MIKPDQVALTQSLQMIIANVSGPEQKELLQAVIEGIVGYVGQHEESLQNGVTRTEALKGFYEMMNDMTNNMSDDVKEMITCKKGCSFCCRMNLDVSRTEARVLIEYSKQKGVPIDLEHLGRQKDLNQQTHLFSTHARCVFLDPITNSCNVYDARPIVCRKYFSGGDPDLCNAVKHPTGMIPVYADIDLELVASALMTLDQDYDSMARMLLSELRPEVKQFIPDKTEHDDEDYDDENDEDDDY